MGISKEFYKKCKNVEFNNYSRFGIVVNHSENAIRLIRTVQYCSIKKGVFSRLLTRIYLNKLITKYGIFFHPESVIGIGLKIPHPNGIVIGKAVTLGENATLYQQVTIGSSNMGDWLVNKQPQIGCNVIIYSGAKVIGDIRIADNVIVGANAVVNRSIIENGSVYAGVPAKKVK